MKKNLIAVLLTISFPHVVYAHASSHSVGFMAGLSHPVLGFDHFLAMISVGILSAQIGGRAIWQVPAAFIGLMLVGGILAMLNIPLFSVELSIACSVLALGLALVADKKLPPLFAMLFVGFFALFHGHAHGTEMPYLAQPALYVLGFVIGTASIHVAGVSVGVVARQLKKGAHLLRYFGAAIAGIGFHLLMMS